MANFHVIFAGGILAPRGIRAERRCVFPKARAADLRAGRAKLSGIKFAELIVPVGWRQGYGF